MGPQLHKLKNMLDNHMLALNSAKGDKENLKLQKIHFGKDTNVTYSFQEQQGQFSKLQWPALGHQWCDQGGAPVSCGTCADPGVDRSVGSVSSMMSQA